MILPKCNHTPTVHLQTLHSMNSHSPCAPPAPAPTTLLSVSVLLTHCTVYMLGVWFSPRKWASGRQDFCFDHRCAGSRLAHTRCSLILVDLVEPPAWLWLSALSQYCSSCYSITFPWLSSNNHFYCTLNLLLLFKIWPLVMGLSLKKD